MNNIPHYNIVIYIGNSETQSYLSKIAIETFYQKSPTRKKGFFER